MWCVRTLYTSSQASLTSHFSITVMKVKALALGADVVYIGRPWVYGLAFGGKAGVKHVLQCSSAFVAPLTNQSVGPAPFPSTRGSFVCADKISDIPTAGILADLDLTMQLGGWRSLEDLGRDCIRRVDV